MAIPPHSVPNWMTDTLDVCHALYVTFRSSMKSSLFCILITSGDNWSNPWPLNRSTFSSLASASALSSPTLHSTPYMVGVYKGFVEKNWTPVCSQPLGTLPPSLFLFLGAIINSYQLHLPDLQFSTSPTSGWAPSVINVFSKTSSSEEGGTTPCEEGVGSVLLVDACLGSVCMVQRWEAQMPHPVPYSTSHPTFLRARDYLSRASNTVLHRNS